MSQSVMVETSALVAIILEEEGWQLLADQIANTNALTSCVMVFEAALAVARELGVTPTIANEIVESAAQALDIEIVAVPPPINRFAAEAREKYGAGRHGLNMGDCLSYGAAKYWRARLVYKGNDFAKTDVND